MVQLIKARYEKGILKPLTKLNIQKNREVELVVFTDKNKFFAVEKELEKMKINYLKLISELLPEIDLGEAENRSLKRILTENRKESYIRVE